MRGGGRPLMPQGIPLYDACRLGLEQHPVTPSYTLSECGLALGVGVSLHLLHSTLLCCRCCRAPASSSAGQHPAALFMVGGWFESPPVHSFFQLCDSVAWLCAAQRWWLLDAAIGSISRSGFCMAASHTLRAVSVVAAHSTLLQGPLDLSVVV